METIGTSYGERMPGSAAGSSAEELKGKATQLKESARTKAMGTLDANKDQVCQMLDKVADTIEDDRLGRYAADYARRGAEYLRRQSSDDLVTIVAGELRRRPGMLLGACFLGGLAFSRMLRR
jgi:hypothetical protein